MTDDRAVSEVLGYVLILGVITATIAVVMTLGIAGLESSQQAEQINNMERAFDVLDHNTNTLIRGDAPTRATELRIVDGSVSYESSTSIEVIHEGHPIGNMVISTHPIVFDSRADARIVYEGGAVMRTDGERTSMLTEPPFLIDDDRLVVTGVRTRPMSGTARHVDDPGTILVRKEYLGTAVEELGITDEPEEVEIVIESTRADAWADYLRQFDELEVDASESGTVTATMEVSDRVVVSQTRIRMTLSP